MPGFATSTVTGLRTDIRRSVQCHIVIIADGGHIRYWLYIFENYPMLNSLTHQAYESTLVIDF